MAFVSKEDLSAILTNLNTKLRKKPTAVRLTQAEYDQLTSEEVHDTTKTYYITDGESGGGGSYTLPIASASELGGIKVGDGLSINSSTGVLSASSGMTLYPLTIKVPLTEPYTKSTYDTTSASAYMDNAEYLSADYNGMMTNIRTYCENAEYPFNTVEFETFGGYGNIVKNFIPFYVSMSVGSTGLGSFPILPRQFQHLRLDVTNQKVWAGFSRYALVDFANSKCTFPGWTNATAISFTGYYLY